MRVDAVLGKTRGLIIVLLSLTLIVAISADYGITPLTDMIWIYSDSSRTVEETVFGDGDTVYLKITDTQTKGGTKAITVQNSTIGNTISVNVTDSDQDSFYLGSFIIYSGLNDDANNKLTMFNGQTASVRVRIFNLNGAIVYDWNEYISSEEEWTWDGVNMYGEAVNNGVYIWRIEARADDGTSNSKTQILGVAR